MSAVHLAAAFAVFDRATGRVLRVGVAEPGHECDQVAEPGEDYVCLDAMPADPNGLVVIDGVLVADPEHVPLRHEG